MLIQGIKTRAYNAHLKKKLPHERMNPMRKTPMMPPIPNIEMPRETSAAVWAEAEAESEAEEEAEAFKTASVALFGEKLSISSGGRKT